MVTPQTTTSRPGSNEGRTECPPDHDLPENSKENLDRKLDHAIEETFPTSDPVSVLITKGPPADDSRGAGASGDQAEQDAAESLLDQVRATLSDAAGSASGMAREAYSQGTRYMRRAGEQYPEAGRYYEESRRALSQRINENPWLFIGAAAAFGYGLAWLIHSRSQDRDEHLPDYARTR